MTPTLNIAVKAVRQAGFMMLRHANHIGSLNVNQKAFNDFVSNVDYQSEKILVEALLKAYPHHVVRSEEGGYFVAQRSKGAVTISQVGVLTKQPEYEWIIDPLDGTTNYLHQHPQYAISMALAHKGVLQEAVVFAPEQNNLYVATKGKGAWLDDKRIRVAKRENLNECLIGTGFPVVDQSQMTRYLAILREVLAKTAGARREGSASLDLCAVACGRFDGFFEFNLKPWDIAGGALIVQEAGGLVTDMAGNSGWLESGDIVAGNGKILAQLLNIIANHIQSDNEIK